MSVMILIPPQVGAFFSPQFSVSPNTEAYITANALSAGEFIQIQVWDTCHANWFDLVLDGVKQLLDNNTNVIGVMGSGVYRLNKTITTVPVGASLER